MPTQNTPKIKSLILCFRLDMNTVKLIESLLISKSQYKRNFHEPFPNIYQEYLCHLLTEYPRTHQDDMADHNKHVLFETCVRMTAIYGKRTG